MFTSEAKKQAAYEARQAQIQSVKAASIRSAS